MDLAAFLFIVGFVAAPVLLVYITVSVWSHIRNNRLADYAKLEGEVPLETVLPEGVEIQYVEPIEDLEQAFAELTQACIKMVENVERMEDRLNALEDENICFAEKVQDELFAYDCRKEKEMTDYFNQSIDNVREMAKRIDNPILKEEDCRFDTKAIAAGLAMVDGKFKDEKVPSFKNLAVAEKVQKVKRVIKKKKAKAKK